MKLVLLAGGYGTRISEESHLKPKPMIEIGGMPILWHIMKYYSCFGVNEFIICAGYKQEVIKTWFSNYFVNTSDITFDLTNGQNVIVHNQNSERWKITVVDTGLDTMTGGRIKRVREYLGEEPFFMTYGDGVADVNLDLLLQRHLESKKLATITAIQPGSRYGYLTLDNDGTTVKAFREKDQIDSGWINAGYMVLDPKIIDYISSDNEMLEQEPFDRIIQQNQLGCYKHYGFWQCMDTLREKELLETLIKKGNAPWMRW